MTMEQENVSPILEKRPPKIWLYAPGSNASRWNRCLEENIMCIGWDELGDFHHTMIVKKYGPHYEKLTISVTQISGTTVLH